MPEAQSPSANGPPLSAGYFTKTLSTEGAPNEPGWARSILRLVPSRVMEKPQTLRPKTLVVLVLLPAGNPTINIDHAAH